MLLQWLGLFDYTTEYESILVKFELRIDLDNCKEINILKSEPVWNLSEFCSQILLATSRQEDKTDRSSKADEPFTHQMVLVNLFDFCINVNGSEINNNYYLLDVNIKYWPLLVLLACSGTNIH